MSNANCFFTSLKDISLPDLMPFFYFLLKHLIFFNDRFLLFDASLMSWALGQYLVMHRAALYETINNSFQRKERFYIILK